MEAQDSAFEHLKRVEDSIDDRRGWDFSRMQTGREPVPWDYIEIVARYLKPTDTVLDVGTGGGEKLLAFSPLFARGVGIDPDVDMIQVARENGATQPNVTFVEMGAERLAFPDATFDVVLTRHAPTVVSEVVRVLRPGGYFVTQQIGAGNMATIREAFGIGMASRTMMRTEPASRSSPDAVAASWQLVSTTYATG